MSILLWIDDWRPAPEGWHWARSNSEAIRILATVPVSEVSLDHDISHYISARECGQMHLIECRDDFRATAYYILAMDPNKKPSRVVIHTGNPVGANEMRRLLEGHIEHLEVERAQPNDLQVVSPQEAHRYKQDIRWKAVLEMQRELEERR